MKYTDMVKKANRFSNLTEEQAIDYMLTNAREMDQDARDAMEERLNTINPREFHYLYPFADAFKKADMYEEVERYNKDFKGLGVDELQDYYKKNMKSSDMTEIKRLWIQKRIGNLRRQKAARERYAKAQTPAYKEKYGPSGQKTQSKVPAMIKDTEPTWYEQNKDWILGTLAGGVSGAAAYGLSGLFPQLRRRRVLRALIGLGAGTLTGIGTSKVV